VSKTLSKKSSRKGNSRFSFILNPKKAKTKNSQIKNNGKEIKEKEENEK